MLILVVIIPAMVCLYALALRPLLHKVPAFAPFYDEADGLWARLRASCGNSLTVAWGYLLGGLGAALELVDRFAPVLGDDHIKAQLSDALQASPKALGYLLAAISVVTIAARLRGLMKG